MKLNKKFIYGISTISSTIIGAGLFALPYLTLQVGFPIILFYFLILGVVAILIHLFLGELALNAPDLKRLPGFASFYLGKWGEKISLISAILGTFGTILAYLIVGGEFLTQLFSPIFGGTSLVYTLIYFAIGATLIFFGIKAISKVEFWGLVLFVLILFTVFFKEASFINIENLFIGNWPLKIENLFLPYGPILFSLWGANIIPEIEEMLGEDKKMLKKIIPIAILIPILIYLLFIYIILGVCGNQTTELALTGLENFFTRDIIFLILIFGLLTTFTSFISLGLTLKKTFCYDLKLNENLSWGLTCFIPLIFFLIGFQSFIEIISIVGGIMLGIDAILILLMYKKQVKSQKSKVKNLLVYPLILVFLGGIVYEIIYFIR